MSPLERELQTALLDLHGKWGMLGYHARYFKRMLICADPKYVKGPVGAVKHLLGQDLTEKSGFERLHKLGKLEWTIENLIKQPKWESLFEPWEIAQARERLRNAKAH